MRRWLHALLRGMASITLWPQPIRTPYTGRDPAQADADVIAGDWRAVGNDLGTAMKRLEADRE